MANCLHPGHALQASSHDVVAVRQLGDVAGHTVLYALCRELIASQQRRWHGASKQWLRHGRWAGGLWRVGCRFLFRMQTFAGRHPLLPYGSRVSALCLFLPLPGASGRARSPVAGNLCLRRHACPLSWPAGAPAVFLCRQVQCRALRLSPSGGVIAGGFCEDCRCRWEHDCAW